MNVMPAKVAGVDEIIMVTPPGKNGKVSPNTLVAAKEAGVDKIYKVGGAQAIAALAYGTESIPNMRSGLFETQTNCVLGRLFAKNCFRTSSIGFIALYQR